MDFTPGQRQLLAYWGTIQRSVEARVSTADLWAAVRADAEAEGISLKGVSAIDMNQLRSIAASQRRTMDSLQRAGQGQVIDSSMIGLDVSARTPQQMALAPRWIVRFEHDITIEGQLITQWRSSIFDGILPQTKGSLQSQVEQDAEAMADKYDITHIGVGRIQISAA